MNTYLVRAYAKDKVYYSLIKLTSFDSKQSFFGEKVITAPPPENYQEPFPKMTKDLACKEKN